MPDVSIAGLEGARSALINAKKVAYDMSNSNRWWCSPTVADLPALPAEGGCSTDESLCPGCPVQNHTPWSRVKG